MCQRFGVFDRNTVESLLASWPSRRIPFKHNGARGFCIGPSRDDNPTRMGEPAHNSRAVPFQRNSRVMWPEMANSVVMCGGILQEGGGKAYARPIPAHPSGALEGAESGVEMANSPGVCRFKPYPSCHNFQFKSSKARQMPVSVPRRCTNSSACENFVLEKVSSLERLGSGLTAASSPVWTLGERPTHLAVNETPIGLAGSSPACPTNFNNHLGYGRNTQSFKLQGWHRNVVFQSRCLGLGVKTSSPNFYPQQVTGVADGIPTLRGRDAALQIEPPEKLTLIALASTRGEVAYQTPESRLIPAHCESPARGGSCSEPRRSDPTPPSDKDCALVGADRSVAKADPSPSCRVV